MQIILYYVCVGYMTVPFFSPEEKYLDFLFISFHHLCHFSLKDETLAFTIAILREN